MQTGPRCPGQRPIHTVPIWALNWSDNQRNRQQRMFRWRGGINIVYGTERTDGLLRGSRDQRISKIRAVEEAPWTLETILGLHCGLLDHAHDVSEAAMDTLIGIALKRPDPVAVTPVALLAYFVNVFTVASGIDARVVRCFAELHTAEADAALSELLESGTGNHQQFENWMTILTATNRMDILRRVHSDRLSANRRKMLKHVVEG